MSRSARVCAAMPTWMLRVILASPLSKRMWSAAYLELWEREVETEIALLADDEHGPWPVAMPAGMH